MTEGMKDWGDGPVTMPALGAGAALAPAPPEGADVDATCGTHVHSGAIHTGEQEK